MPETIEDVQPLAGFDLHAESVLRQLKESHRPVGLTVDGKVELVVMDAEQYERLQSMAAASMEFDDEGLDEALAEAEEDIRMGRTKPAEEVFREIGLKYGFSSEVFDQGGKLSR